MLIHYNDYNVPLILISSANEASVRISSADGIQAEILPHLINQSTDPPNLFDVMVWIDLQNQRNNCYGGDMGQGCIIMCWPLI